ncbi:hypothetical protein P8C59_000784 [Phyllachora maydis]|uniref:Uncharacterized protein n=1 Tax=Phyllachora maydis TaxID=1825666 RepID=A0AAD9HXY7_9PEZI|nr:hypothetical protein P8C59_000784 [Phyllachora maydis]
MGLFHIRQKHRLIATIFCSSIFFATEIIVAYRTKSLALLADSFHYMNDLIGFVVALAALMVSERTRTPQGFSFGWQRARILGAFFNGVFLAALGLSILLQGIERFISPAQINTPELILIMGCVGFGLNTLSAVFLHEHGHHEHAHGGGGNASTAREDMNDSTAEFKEIMHLHHGHRHRKTNIKAAGRDLGMFGVLIHVACDAINNLGVMVAAVILWKVESPKAVYADPAVSLFIAIMIMLSSVHLIKHSGIILLQSAPLGVDLDDVKHDLEQIPGVESVHELHVWRLDQAKAIASAHIVVSDQSVASFMEKARTIRECLHEYGIHSLTLEPEMAPSVSGSAGPSIASAAVSSCGISKPEGGACQSACSQDFCV